MLDIGALSDILVVSDADVVYLFGDIPSEIYIYSDGIGIIRFVVGVVKPKRSSLRCVEPFTECP